MKLLYFPYKYVILKDMLYAWAILSHEGADDIFFMLLSGFIYWEFCILLFVFTK